MKRRVSRVASAEANSEVGRQSGRDWRFRREGSRPGYARRFAFRRERGYGFIEADAIDWIDADGQCARAHTAVAEYVLPQPIGRLEYALDPRWFVRIHRSTIVNVSRIASLKALGGREWTITLSTGTELRSSRSYADRIRQLLGLKMARRPASRHGRRPRV